MCVILFSFLKGEGTWYTLGYVGSSAVKFSHCKFSCFSLKQFNFRIVAWSCLYVCSRTFTLRQGFSLCGFSLHMAGSCQKRCEGWKGSSAALLNHGVPSTSQNSCRVGAGRPQIRVHWSVYIRSLSVYQSDITPVSRTIDFTVLCSKKMEGKWTCV